jgi:uncharacterized protein (TIGR03067 family)
MESEKLIGTWSYVSGEMEGDKVNAEGLQKSSVIITKDAITLKDEDAEYLIKYHLDTQKKPWAIAMEITAGPSGQGSKSTGIIELQGDELKFCYAARGGPAPTEFAGKKDSGNHYFVLKWRK